MIQCPDPCPGPAQFASTDIALVTYKEWLTKVVMKVLATSLGTDRSCFSCVYCCGHCWAFMFLLFSYSEAVDLNTLPALSQICGIYNVLLLPFFGLMIWGSV